MTVENFNISDDKIKLKYRERYTTEGLNEKTSALPRGCYRGFVPRKSAVADASIWLAVDPLGYGVDEDSFAMFADYNDGAPNYDAWALSVRETTDVELALAGSSLIPIPAGVSYLFVYLEASYSIGSVTAAMYRVSDEDPSLVASSNYNPNAVLIGRVPVTPATSVIDFDITSPAVYADVTSARKWPAPTVTSDWTTLEAGNDRWGLIDSVRLWAAPTVDQKNAMDNASTPTSSNPFATEGDVDAVQANVDALETQVEDFEDVVIGQPALLDYTGFSGISEFQLTGKTIYIGKGGTDSADNKYVMLRTYQDAQDPLWNASTGVKLLVQDIYDSTNSHKLDPSTEADAEGFYAEPWVKILAYTGNLSVFCTEKKTLRTVDQAPADLSGLLGIVSRLFTDDVGAAAVAGSPDSLPTGTLSSQLSLLLGHVNDRIDKIYPGVPTSPTLLWRSHNVTSDAAVTGATISIYISPTSFIICRGMYLNGATAYKAPVSPESSASAMLLREDQQGFYKQYLGGAITTWDWTNDSAWGWYWNFNYQATIQIGKTLSLFDVTLQTGVCFRFNPPGVGNAQYTALYGSTPYVSTVMKDTTLFRLGNCTLPGVGTGDEVNPISSSVPMVASQIDGDSGMLRFLCSTNYRTGFSSGHDLPSSDWSAKMNLMEHAAEKGTGVPSGDYVYNCFNSHANVFERIAIHVGLVLSATSGDVGGGMSQGYNFRNRLNVAPIAGDLHESIADILCISGPGNITKWGFSFTMLGTTVGTYVDFGAQGYIDVYQ